MHEKHVREPNSNSSTISLCSRRRQAQSIQATLLSLQLINGLVHPRHSDNRFGEGDTAQMVRLISAGLVTSAATSALRFLRRLSTTPSSSPRHHVSLLPAARTARRYHQAPAPCDAVAVASLASADGRTDGLWEEEKAGTSTTTAISPPSRRNQAADASANRPNRLLLDDVPVAGSPALGPSISRHVVEHDDRWLLYAKSLRLMASCYWNLYPSEEVSAAAIARRISLSECSGHFFQ